jgi:hypothetical protein
MKNIEFYKNFRTPMLYMIIFLLLSNTVIAQYNISSNIVENSPKKKTRYWNIDLSISPLYDNNILKYSDKYIERFLNREDEGRFHIHSLDDLVMDYSLEISYSKNIVKKHKSIFSASIDYTSYSYNPVKSWASFEFALRQAVTKKTSFWLAYSHIPKYYINHFRDDDWIAVYGFTPETFQPYDYAKNDLDFWIQQNIFSSTRARLYFSYTQYRLNEHFTEYDSDNLLLGIGLFHSLTKRINVNGSYKFVYSKAKGYDEVGETIGTSDDVDATYDEHIFSAGVGFQLPKIFKLKTNVNLYAQYSRKLYTTNHFGENDPLHAGRYDDYFRIGLDYNIKVLSNISLTAFLNWNMRNSQTTFQPNDEYVSDEKDYSQYQAGITFNYEFKF